MESQVAARRRVARLAWIGEECPGATTPSQERQGTAGVALTGTDGMGQAGRREARLDRLGLAQQGGDRIGMVRLRKAGMEWRGWIGWVRRRRVRIAETRPGQAGKARTGGDAKGLARHGWQGAARPGLARRIKARLERFLFLNH